MSFQAYCESNGIELMPDDLKFIKHVFDYIPKSKHKNILTTYAALWVQAMNETPICYKKQNAGRRAANSYIFNFL